jgi:hypothetical protein
MVCDRITPVVRPVISEAQHGFVKCNSTVGNLVPFTNGVIGEIEDGWQGDGVYTGFRQGTTGLYGVLSDRSNKTYVSNQFNVIPGLRRGVTWD